MSDVKVSKCIRLNNDPENTSHFLYSLHHGKTNPLLQVMRAEDESLYVSAANYIRLARNSTGLKGGKTPLSEAHKHVSYSRVWNRELLRDPIDAHV